MGKGEGKGEGWRGKIRRRMLEMAALEGRERVKGGGGGGGVGVGRKVWRIRIWNLRRLSSEIFGGGMWPLEIWTGLENTSRSPSKLSGMRLESERKPEPAVVVSVLREDVAMSISDFANFIRSRMSIGSSSPKAIFGRSLGALSRLPNTPLSYLSIPASTFINLTSRFRL